MDNTTLLGKDVSYRATYDPSLLCPLPRAEGRRKTGIDPSGPSYYGEDIWNIYELSWLGPTGQPEVAMAELRVPASSPNLIESKSLKLYCNSFNMSRFSNPESVKTTMVRDLGESAGAEVTVALLEPDQFGTVRCVEPTGYCLDQLTVTPRHYTPAPELLATGEREVTETLFSRLFRSCCPVTGQPDWATVTISYRGRQLVHAGLLAYLISFRQHNGFHEACVETIFADILARCRPEELTVSARFTRRGGIDINPWRSTRDHTWPNLRDPRQ